MVIRWMVIVVLTAPMQACAAARVNCFGMEMSEALCAHKMSIDAVSAQSNGEKACYDSIAADYPNANSDPTIEAIRGMKLAMCRGNGGNSVQVPQYVAPPTLGDRALQWTQTLIPVAGLLVNAKLQDNANRRATESSVLITGINANRENRNMDAMAGLGSSGFQAIQNTALGGYQAVTTTASNAFEQFGTGFFAMERLGSAAIAAGSYNSSVWGTVFANQRATYQLGAGAIFVAGQAEIDQSTTGRDRDVTRNCVSDPSSVVSSAQQGSVSGTTGPSFALGFTPQINLPTNIQCGG